MRTIAIVQARMGSTRLPGKVLMPLGDKPVLQWVVERTRVAIPEVVIATTEELADDAVAALGRMLNVPVIRYGTGPAVNDVITRFRRVLEQFPCDAFVRVTADCPLIEPVLIRRLLWQVKYEAWPINSSPIHSEASVHTGLPDGLDCEIVKTSAFRRELDLLLTPKEREHVTAMYRDAGITRPLWRLLRWPYARDPKRYRLTLDTQRDYERLQRIWAEVPHGWHGPDTLGALAWLEQHPEWSTTPD